MELPIDRYTIRARVAPGLIAILPMFFGVTAWSAAGLSWPESALWSVILGLLSLLGAQFIRDAGYRCESLLFARWHGAPSTRFLRHSDTTLDPNTKQRYHARLTALLPGVTLPTTQDESSDPARADGIYKSCGDHLRERTRDKEKFGHLHEANIDYGFRRNLWAIKRAGLVVAGGGTVVAAIRAYWLFAHGGSGSLARLPLLCCVANAVLTVWWVFGITPRWVAAAADSYAKHLLSACEVLQPEAGHDAPPGSSIHSLYRGQANSQQ